MKGDENLTTLVNIEIWMTTAYLKVRRHERQNPEGESS
jgi:hypothetical protein